MERQGVDLIKKQDVLVHENKMFEGDRNYLNEMNLKLKDNYNLIVKEKEKCKERFKSQLSTKSSEIRKLNFDLQMNLEKYLVDNSDAMNNSDLAAYEKLIKENLDLRQNNVILKQRLENLSMYEWFGRESG